MDLYEALQHNISNMRRFMEKLRKDIAEISGKAVGGPYHKIPKTVEPDTTLETHIKKYYDLMYKIKRLTEEMERLYCESIAPRLRKIWEKHENEPPPDMDN